MLYEISNWRRVVLSQLLPLSLALAVGLFVGCNGGDDGRTFTEEDDVENVSPIVGHDHSHGPHDGHLVVFGDEAYHGEIVFNEESGELSVYIIKADATTLHPIEEESVAVHLELDGEEVELTLPASPETTDPEGKASRFVLETDEVPEGIRDAEDLHGHIVATIDGEEYEGEITHDHGHDHAHSHEHEHADDGDAAHEHEHADEESGDEEAAGDHEHSHEDDATHEHEHSHDDEATGEHEHSHADDDAQDESETEGEATEQ